MDFREDLAALYRTVDEASTLNEVVEPLAALLSRHPDTLAHITASYRLSPTDSPESFAFALHGGKLERLAQSAPTDVTVIGASESLMAVFQKKLSPMAALLRGKVRIKGNKGALLKLAELL